jgi:translation elongation factor EF-4
MEAKEKSGSEIKRKEKYRSKKKYGSETERKEKFGKQKEVKKFMRNFC